MQVRTLLLDCGFTLKNADSVPFTSDYSVFDYDLVIWDPRGTLAHYEGQYVSHYRGRPAPNEADSVVLAGAVDRRNREFRDFLDHGRALVVIASPAQIVWIDTGDRTTSGTGRNQKVTKMVKDVDLMSVLPFEYEAIEGSGVALELAAESANDLWQETRTGWLYRCTLATYPGTVLFRVGGTDKVAGAITRLTAVASSHSSLNRGCQTTRTSRATGMRTPRLSSGGSSACVKLTRQRFLVGAPTSSFRVNWSEKGRWPRQKHQWRV